MFINDALSFLTKLKNKKAKQWCLSDMWLGDKKAARLKISGLRERRRQKGSDSGGDEGRKGANEQVQYTHAH